MEVAEIAAAMHACQPLLRSAL